MKHNDKDPAPHGAHILYIIFIAVCFVGLSIVFIFFPRSRHSELEKRDLAEFPNLNEYGEKYSQLPSDISSWFSDSAPYRDFFMGMSMNVRNMIGMRFGDPSEQISYTKSDDGAAEAQAADPDELLEAAGNPLANANAKMANSGIIVVGSGPEVRALMGYGGTAKMGESFVKVVRDYREALPGINLYAIIPPIATEFYLPEKAQKLSKPQKPVIDYIGANLPAGAKLVDSYSYLAAHTNENIYLRTDHHWAPLGAFYAAKALAKSAGVPFRELDSYDPHVIHGYVGSMYGYSKDVSVKNAPEDFVYYTPRGLNHKTTYVAYKTGKNYRVTSASQPYEGNFFHTFGDGSSNAYLTFMGGDQFLVKVKTGTNSNRKLLVIKDSFGNPVPSFLFYSFGEIHVVDFRYFPQNMVNYVRQNGITDLAFIFNTFNAVGNSSMARVSQFLTQDGSLAPASADETDKAQSKSSGKESSKASAKESSRTTEKENRKDSKKKENPTFRDSSPSKSSDKSSASPKKDTQPSASGAAEPTE